MDNDAAGFDGHRGAAPRFDTADSIDDQVETVFLDRFDGGVDDRELLFPGGRFAP